MEGRGVFIFPSHHLQPVFPRRFYTFHQYSLCSLLLLCWSLTQFLQKVLTAYPFLSLSLVLSSAGTSSIFFSLLWCFFLLRFFSFSSQDHVCCCFFISLAVFCRWYKQALCLSELWIEIALKKIHWRCCSIFNPTRSLVFYLLICNLCMCACAHAYVFSRVCFCQKRARKDFK